MEVAASSRMAESGVDCFFFCKKWSLEDEGVHELLGNAADVVAKRRSLVGAGSGSRRCLCVVGRVSGGRGWTCA